MARHLAAIHVLKHKLAMSDDDYRALLLHLTGYSSAKALSASEQARVRRHLQKLAEPAQATTPDRAVWDATPMERKVWALWKQLGRDGIIADTSAPALRAWIKRQNGMEDLRFCDWPQLSRLIEALKRWQQRGQEG
ncbi:regulatory protein GemA [Comamonas sp. NLF-1-9]|uniref:regulatory protein GemA n=1 Tax=Comamonas sp. NLF-1-9 TaxID=2853163 RepID=UPI001C4503A6|nr:regulatory protein GemA [Comamonas sp. NLF-1-9]QXL84101.1 regulatory protein GemA [Comamonas sp. NLF-1-9]